MNSLVLKIIILLCFIKVSKTPYGQNTTLNKDSIIAFNILKKSNINNRETASLNSNGLKLNLSKQEVVKIMKTVLYSIYGKKQIHKQKPFHIMKIGKYWIAWGQKKNKGYGGVFELVINSENGCIEYVSHGK